MTIPASPGGPRCPAPTPGRINEKDSAISAIGKEFVGFDFSPIAPGRSGSRERRRSPRVDGALRERLRYRRCYAARWDITKLWLGNQIMLCYNAAVIRIRGGANALA